MRLDGGASAATVIRGEPAVVRPTHPDGAFHTLRRKAKISARSCVFGFKAVSGTFDPDQPMPDAGRLEGPVELLRTGRSGPRNRGCRA